MDDDFDFMDYVLNHEIFAMIIEEVQCEEKAMWQGEGILSSDEEEGVLSSDEEESDEEESDEEEDEPEEDEQEAEPPRARRRVGGPSRSVAVRRAAAEAREAPVRRRPRARRLLIPSGSGPRCKGKLTQPMPCSVMEPGRAGNLAVCVGTAEAAEEVAGLQTTRRQARLAAEYEVREALKAAKKSTRNWGMLGREWSRVCGILRSPEMMASMHARGLATIPMVRHTSRHPPPIGQPIQLDPFAPGKRQTKLTTTAGVKDRRVYFEAVRMMAAAEVLDLSQLGCSSVRFRATSAAVTARSMQKQELSPCARPAAFSPALGDTWSQAVMRVVSPGMRLEHPLATVALAVNVLGRVALPHATTKRPNPVPSLGADPRAVVAACLNLASKIEGDSAIDKSELAFIMREAEFDRERYHAAERAVLRSIRYNMHVPTAFSFMYYFCRASIPTRLENELCKWLVFTSMFFDEFHAYVPSRVAAAAVLYTRRACYNGVTWTVTLQSATGYSTTDLELPCAIFARVHAWMRESKLVQELLKPVWDRLEPIPLAPGVSQDRMEEATPADVRSQPLPEGVVLLFGEER